MQIKTPKPGSKIYIYFSKIYIYFHIINEKKDSDGILKPQGTRYKALKLVIYAFWVHHNFMNVYFILFRQGF